MQVAFIIFKGMTSLDLIGVLDPVTRLKTMGYLPDLDWELCSFSDQVEDQAGLSFVPTKVRASLEGFDIIIVPGGPGTRKLMRNKKFLAWLQTAKACKLKVSVCTGSLLLGAAGFLKGKKATTHHSAFRILRRFSSSVEKNKRIVDEGDVITAAGVTSSIDLGLYLCEKIAGEAARVKISQQIEYTRSTTNLDCSRLMRAQNL
jgi:cyclohexyl-isocyanide hydratase